MHVGRYTLWLREMAAVYGVQAAIRVKQRCQGPDGCELIDRTCYLY